MWDAGNEPPDVNVKQKPWNKWFEVDKQRDAFAQFKSFVAVIGTVSSFPKHPILVYLSQ